MQIQNSDNYTLANFPLKKGVYDAVFSVGSSQNWKMKLSIPEIQSNKKYPVILALHWGGGGTTAYQEYADCLAFPALDTLEGIIIAPTSDGMHWTLPINENRLLDLVREVKKYWPVLENKIIVTGYSNGGIGSWYLADKYPEIFAAALPVSGYYRAAELRIPTYVIHGKSDELFAIKEVENAIELSRKKGSDIYLKVVEEGTHYMGCSYIQVLQETALKMQKEVF